MPKTSDQKVLILVQAGEAASLPMFQPEGKHGRTITPQLPGPSWCTYYFWSVHQYCAIRAALIAIFSTPVLKNPSILSLPTQTQRVQIPCPNHPISTTSLCAKLMRVFHHQSCTAIQPWPRIFPVWTTTPVIFTLAGTTYTRFLRGKRKQCC